MFRRLAGRRGSLSLNTVVCGHLRARFSVECLIPCPRLIEAGGRSCNGKRSVVRDDAQRNRTLIFVHLPKTGGVTLTELIYRQIGRDKVFQITAGKIHDSILRFSKMSSHQRSQYDAVVGHMPIGIDRFIPQESMYMTLLRDPIERLISEYYFIKRNPEHRIHKEIASGSMDLRRYVERQQDNVLVRRLWNYDLLGSKTYWAEFRSQPVKGKMIDEAKSNLRDRFGVVGLCERFDETVMLIASELGWGFPFYEEHNVTPDRPTRYDIDPQTRRLIEEKTEFDQELYRYAEEIYAEAWSKLGLRDKINALAYKVVQSCNATRPAEYIKWSIQRIRDFPS